MVLASNVLKKWEIEPVEDSDGLNTQISVNMEIEVDAQALMLEEQVIIDDAYSIDYKLDLKSNAINLITDEREVTDSVDLNQRIRVDDPSGQMAEVLMVCANERNIASMMNDNMSISRNGRGRYYICLNRQANKKSSA